MQGLVPTINVCVCSLSRDIMLAEPRVDWGERVPGLRDWITPCLGTPPTFQSSEEEVQYQNYRSSEKKEELRRGKTFADHICNIPLCMRSLVSRRYIYELQVYEL